MDITRRELVKRMGVLLAGSGLASCTRHAAADAPGVLRQVPLIHTTDLYHPPQDPDDHVDLATACALREYDLEGVVLDVTERFLYEAPVGSDIPRDPGFVPVAQLAHITGRPIPVAQGPIRPLSHPGDTCEDAAVEEEAGIRMILDILRRSAEPVVISVSGSARVVTAAYNREPVLVKTKTSAVLLNAGSTGGPKTEWNVQLDPQAYIGLWQSDLPIHWYPPGTDTGAFDPAPERGTYWSAEQADLFRNIPHALGGYFAYALSNDPSGDIIRALTRDGMARSTLLSGKRNLWSTASLVVGAGRVLAKTGAGWRFLPAADAAGLDTWPWRLDPIHAEVDREGRVSWQAVDTGGNRRIFGRRPGAEFGAAMTEALNALFRNMPL